MKQLPNYLKPNIENKENYYIDECMKLLRKSITNYILTENLSFKFFNLSDFYLKNKINNDSVKSSLNNQIITELKNYGWCVANLFNNTGIVICNDMDEMEKSVWKTTLDFKIS